MAQLTGFIDHVQDTIQRGYAYVSGNSVYFDYGRWNSHPTEVVAWNNQTILRIAHAALQVPKEKDVRTHGDFCLWYGGEDSLKLASPWGPGEPGADMRKRGIKIRII